jgi:hypothetical protein
MMQEVAMIKRAFLDAALLALLACGSEPKRSPEELKLQRDAFAFALAIQLHAVSYTSTVTTEGDTVNIRVGAASVPDVRRAMCRRMGWPSAEGKMVRMAVTLAFLRLAGQKS